MFLPSEPGPGASGLASAYAAKAAAQSAGAVIFRIHKWWI